MKAYLQLIFSMLIWGTLPLFVSVIQHSSAEIVLGRLIFGSLFLLVVHLLTRSRLPRNALKKYGPRLLITGAVMGFNWMLLFESYRFVDVTVATLAYYCAPLWVMLGSVVLLKEKLSLPRLVSIAAAVVGLVLVTGAELGGSDPLRGILLALGSSLLYACVTLSNKFVRDLSGLQSTLLQLLGALVVIIPYVLLTHSGPWQPWLPEEFGAIIILGLVHTGLALFLYFSSLPKLPGQSVALCSYIDPMSALFFAAIFLNQWMTLPQWIGALLILGSALCGELLPHRKKKSLSDESKKEISAS